MKILVSGSHGLIGSALVSLLDGREIGRHTSELQSHVNLVCRLLLEKKKYRALAPALCRPPNRGHQPTNLLAQPEDTRCRRVSFRRIKPPTASPRLPHTRSWQSWLR